MLSNVIPGRWSSIWSEENAAQAKNRCTYILEIAFTH